jgi:hypothetical protein
VSGAVHHGTTSTRSVLGIDRPLGDHSVLACLAALQPSAIGVATELFPEDEWSALVERATRWSRAAVELSALTLSEFETVADYLRQSTPQVRHLSLHGPLVLDADGEAGVVERLSSVGTRLAAFIQHPHILRHPARLRPLGSLVALENMDAAKSRARVVTELDGFFSELPNARLCLDVAHAKTLDATMNEAHRLLDAFGDRLCELHISGIDENCDHVPLTLDDVKRYRAVLLRCRHVPWILESLPADSSAS